MKSAILYPLFISVLSLLLGLLAGCDRLAYGDIQAKLSTDVTYSYSQIFEDKSVDSIRIDGLEMVDSNIHILFNDGIKFDAYDSIALNTCQHGLLVTKKDKALQVRVSVNKSKENYDVVLYRVNLCLSRALAKVEETKRNEVSWK